jgi:hypothetical protein
VPLPLSIEPRPLPLSIEPRQVDETAGGGKRSALGTLRHILATRGVVKGLFRGAGVTAVRDVPGFVMWVAVAGWIVAVAGWGWHRWIGEIGAVRMVPDTQWQWQY